MNERTEIQERVMLAMFGCSDALARDAIEHEVRNDPDDPSVSLHRLILNGRGGPWVSKVAIAHNGRYCATHPYYAGEMPRVFFAIAIYEHEFRQPSGDASSSRSPLQVAVPNPGPGVEAGTETPPPPLPGPHTAGGGEVPRLVRRDSPPPCVDCGTTTTHREDCATRRRLIGACPECDALKETHYPDCSRAKICKGCRGRGQNFASGRPCRACGGSGEIS